MSFVPTAEFGPFLKQFRESRHLSKLDVEKITGIGRSTLGRWEKGDVQTIRHSTLKQFAESFALTINEFEEEFEAYKRKIALDTVQAANSPTSNDTPVTKSNEVKPVIIAGRVLCANNEPVVGIWVDVFEGSTVNKDISGYADLRTPNSNGSEVTFVKVLQGDAYNLHVGCGGSKEHWKGVYITEVGTGAVHDHEFHYFVCHDAYPGIDYGSCELKY